MWQTEADVVSCDMTSGKGDDELISERDKKENQKKKHRQVTKSKNT